MKVAMGLKCQCDPQTQYECGGLGIEECEYSIPTKYAVVELCQSRHNTPAVHGAIFPNIVENMNPLTLEREAKNMIEAAGVEFLTVYVTGLSMALVAVINACRDLGVSLMLMHYNPTTGKYHPQFVRR